jgi:hypothetical protein
MLHCISEKERIKLEKQVKLCYTFDTRRCENGGLLKYNGDERGIMCECTPNYSGEKCEKGEYSEFMYCTPKYPSGSIIKIISGPVQI